MTIFHLLLIFFWFIFLVYWVISSFNVKKTTARSFQSQMGLRLLVAIVILAFFHTQISERFGTFQLLSPHNILTGVIGVVLGAAGIGIAIWARYFLGRNWGMPMTVKEEKPELVKTGPYAYVRHPIYTGVLLAILGSVFVSGVAWFVIFLIAFAYFFYSAKTEERNMVKIFPKEYPAYMKRTKILIPFLF